MIDTLREIREEFRKPIHQGTSDALCIVGFGSMLGGWLLASSGSLAGSAAGVLLAIAAFLFAGYRMPDAETVAIEWREHQRLDEEADRR